MTGCTALKILQVQHVPTHRVHVLLSSAQSNKNIEQSFDLLEKAMQEEFFQALFGKAIDDGDYRLERAHIFQTDSTKHSQFRNAESPS